MASAGSTKKPAHEKEHNTHELRDKHEKEDKNPEEQAEYDEEVLYGGDEDVKTIHDLDEEVQREKLKKFVENKMDANKDNFVDLAELTKYSENSMEEMHNRELKEEFANLDSNHDGQITWKEYADETHGDYEWEKEEWTPEEVEAHQKQVDFDKKMFFAADKNDDKQLAVAELEAMRNPTLSEATKKAFIEKALLDQDTNKDGAVDMKEHIAHLKQEIEEHEDKDPDWISKEEKKFKDELDTDKDGKIKGDEFFKVSRHMPLSVQAAMEAKHLIRECDQNNDGKLTLDEILNNHHEWLQSQTTNFGKHLMDEL